MRPSAQHGERVYESTSDEKLRELSGRKELLTEVARLALEAECERRALFKLPEDPPLPVGATPCADHPTLAVDGTCARCGRFICARCQPVDGARPRHCGACQRLLAIDPELVGLVGWLIVPGIGMIISLFFSVPMLVLEFQRIEPAALGGRAVLTAAIAHWVIEVCLTGAMALTLWAFMRRKAVLPAFFIGLVVLRLAGGVLQSVFERAAEGAVDFQLRGLAMVFNTVIWGAIWVPYLLLSKRAKATFVEP